MSKTGFTIIALALVAASSVACGSREDRMWSDMQVIMEKTQPLKSEKPNG